MEITTPVGIAHVELHEVDAPRGLLLLGHGAGGGTGSADLRAACEAALALEVNVGLVDQPYRVAGRRAPAPAHQLDAAWLAVVAALGAPLPPASAPRPVPLFCGGRSSGARVACRTAAEAGAAGVICLAFPLHPPGKPEKSRLGELEGVEVPVLVVQGERDPFGMPPGAPAREVVTVAGTHTLRAVAPVHAAVSHWLAARL
jgi:predicted alpha/beta-hydrolase family hydrolase